MSLSYQQKRAQIQQNLKQLRQQDTKSSQNLHQIIEDEEEEQKENFQPVQISQRQFTNRMMFQQNNQNEMEINLDRNNFQQQLQPIPDNFDIEEEVSYVIPKNEFNQIQQKQPTLFDINNQNQNSGSILELNYGNANFQQQQSDSFIQTLQIKMNENQQNQAQQDQNSQKQQNSSIQFGMQFDQYQNIQKLFSDDNTKGKEFDFGIKADNQNPQQIFQVNNQASNNQDTGFIQQLLQNRAVPNQQNNNNYLYMQNNSNNVYFVNSYTNPTQVVMHQLDQNMPSLAYNSQGQSIKINQDYFCEEEPQQFAQKSFF
ncbi:hypothetical protein ABPG74_003291 [Tetrahymena malaccensis]